MRSIVCSFLLAGLVLAGCGGSSSEGSAPEGASGGTVRLVAYSTPREAYAKLIDAFKAGRGEAHQGNVLHRADTNASITAEESARTPNIPFSTVTM